MIWFTFCMSKTCSPGPARFAPGVIASWFFMESSLDDAVRAELQGLGDCKAQRGRGVHIDHQFEARRLLDRQVARLRALEDLIHQLRRAPEQLDLITAIANQASGLGERRAADRRQAMLERQGGEFA